MQLLNIKGRVISVEKNLDQEVKRNNEKHLLGRKIILLEGSSTSEYTIKKSSKLWVTKKIPWSSLSRIMATSMF
ncbi:hypothetical protein IIA15_01750 [candidate division TA06 bacterium]|nr:hypothetical protein [candidate division TA06 bacterium]